MRFVLASLVVLSVAAGCGGNVVVKPGAGGGTTSSTTGSTTSGSTTGSGCKSDADCPSAHTCDTATGYCVATGCTTDTDCLQGETCDTATGMCYMAPPPGCTSNADCNADEVCDTTTGACVFQGCLSDADCLPGETCDTATGICMGTPVNGPSCHQCACIDLLSMGGCANVCDMAQNGTSTPNFCNGVAALPQCAKCLVDNCGTIANPPNPADPSACM
jgi:hypothetical protein